MTPARERSAVVVYAVQRPCVVEHLDSDPLLQQSPLEAASHGLDLDESDNCNELLISNTPSSPDPSGSLNLNLFGHSHTVGEEEPSLPASPSPRTRTSALPLLDNGEEMDNCEAKNRPLFEPSDFNVFENDWDAIPSGSSQSTSPVSSSVPGTVYSPLSDRFLIPYGR